MYPAKRCNQTVLSLRQRFDLRFSFGQCLRNVRKAKENHAVVLPPQLCGPPPASASFSFLHCPIREICRSKFKLLEHRGKQACADLLSSIFHGSESLP